MTDPAYSMTMHSSVLAALHDHGGHLVASFELDADGRTVGARVTHNKAIHCSQCGVRGHNAKRCNGEGQPPKPPHRERVRAAEATARRIRQADRDLEAARAEIARRIKDRER